MLAFHHAPLYLQTTSSLIALSLIIYLTQTIIMCMCLVLIRMRTHILYTHAWFLFAVRFGIAKEYLKIITGIINTHTAKCKLVSVRNRRRNKRDSRGSHAWDYYSSHILQINNQLIIKEPMTTNIQLIN